MKVMLNEQQKKFLINSTIYIFFMFASVLVLVKCDCKWCMLITFNTNSRLN